MKIQRRDTKFKREGSRLEKKKSRSLLAKLGFGADDDKKVDAIQETFATKLAEIEEVNTQEEFDALLDDITAAGSLLQQQPVPENLVVYKRLIQRFMKTVIEEGYIVREKIGRKSLIEEKLYRVVEKVNEQLEELSEEILNQQADSLKLAGRLDEIRGLLIDLYK